jgi:hypothetical protein
MLRRTAWPSLVLGATLLLTRAADAGTADWAAIVVAGDWHAHSGAPSEVFDNARRDITRTLVQIGFRPANIGQFSVRPDRYLDANPGHADTRTIATALWDLSNRTTGGCLAYFTSHGSPDGIVMDDSIFPPEKMAQIVGNACGIRPTVVVVSACYSGVFVPALAAPNRLVLTAARSDRTSFGCGETDKYTFFDSCMMQSLKPSGDFIVLARDVQACVAAREKEERVDYPSEPQLYVGAEVRKDLPRWK